MSSLRKIFQIIDGMEWAFYFLLRGCVNGCVYLFCLLEFMGGRV